MLYNTNFSISNTESANHFLYLHALNQDQGPSLFGFQTKLEKETFMLIISCSGIGPKMGISILEQMDPSMFLQAIIENDKSSQQFK